MERAHIACIVAAAIFFACIGGAGDLSPTGARPPLAESDHQRLARRALEDGRRFRAQGRVEAAARAFERGLASRPHDASLHRELASALDVLGRGDEAAAHRARADALAPPPPPLPEEPLAPAPGLLIALLPPDVGDERPDRVPASWPHGVAARTLEERLALRLPGARVVHADPEGVGEARRWLEQHGARAALSLRVDRAHCGASIKDGRFALAWLRVAAEESGRETEGPHWRREVIADPDLPAHCESGAIARALEHALALPVVAEALRAAPGPDPAWSRGAIRSLFPGIGTRIERELASGVAALGAGALGEALQAFRLAAEIDPGDALVRAYLRETEETLAIARELGGEPDALDPRLAPEEKRALESQLAGERRLREELLRALAVLDEDVRVPATAVLEGLHAAPLHASDGFGPTLARERAGGPIEQRVAYAPDGGVVARYFFPVGEELPVVREEDTTGDGQPDRWIAYLGPARREIFEDGRGHGRPDLRLVFAIGGEPLERVEIDRDLDGHPERVFAYHGGTLASEDSDTDGDGRLDRFDRFDPDGRVAVRAEDVDGDGDIDVRSFFRSGRLERRELSTGEEDAAGRAGAEAVRRPAQAGRAREERHP